MLSNALKPATFDAARVKEVAAGGGIIPVSRRQDGQVVLLLAKEQYISAWKGSWRWSGFEGGRKPGETIEQTSIREWREESLDSIATFAVDDLEQNKYVCRYTISIVHKHHREQAMSDRYHVTYLINIPFDEEYPKRFSQRRRRLLAVHAAASALRAATATCTGIHKTLIDFSTTSDRCSFHFVNGTSVTFEAPVPPMVAKWMELHSVLVDAVRICGPHDAMQVFKSVNHVILGAEIQADYLEKERIQWWTLGELKNVLRNGGKFYDESFRTYFLPVLQGLVDFLEQHMSDNWR